jgi:hypothetical protein
MPLSNFRPGSIRLNWALFMTAAFYLAVFAAAPIIAQDVKALLKQYSKEQRQAEKDMFSGKTENAISSLENLRNLLARIKEVAPDNPQLKTATNKYKKLVKDLERKTGQDLGGGSTTVAKGSGVELPPKPKAKSLEKTTPDAPAAASPGSPPAVAATKVDKLPGAVTSRIKKIDKSLDKVNKDLDRNSVQRAEFEFKNVRKIYNEIQDRYGDQAPADHPEMIALSERIATVENRLQGMVGEAAAAEASANKAKEENAALASQWNGRLASFVTSGSDKRLETMPWKLNEEDAARNRKNYQEAVVLFREYETVSFPLGKPMDLKNTESSLRDALKNLEKAYAKQETEKGSEEWVKKLEPFVASTGPKQLIASYTSDVNQIKQQKEIYEQASAIFKQYQQVEFPKGKSFRLQQIEDKLTAELAEFPKTLQRSVGDQVKNAEAKLDQEIAFLKSKQDWKTDTKELPYVLSESRINDARKLIDRATALVPADDPGLVKLNEKMAELIKMNDERRKVHAERIRMIPDRFEGDGIKVVKEKASELVQSKFNGIQILRVTVISGDWKEETVKEWTDTTKSAVRIRTTRGVTAQVAGKKANGEVRLYTIYIAKDRRSDGTWGKLYGNLHSDLGDLMLEENVNKK